MDGQAPCDNLWIFVVDGGAGGADVSRPVIAFGYLLRDRLAALVAVVHVGSITSELYLATAGRVILRSV